MQILSLILAQSQGGGMSGIFMIVAMIVIFYFFMIRPQQKKQKEIKRQREAMAKGDKVVTAGGIHGRITADKDTYMLVEIAPGVNIRVDKASLYPEPEAVPAKSKDNASKSSKKNQKEEEVEEVTVEEVDEK